MKDRGSMISFEGGTYLALVTSSHVCCHHFGKRHVKSYEENFLMNLLLLTSKKFLMK